MDTIQFLWKFFQNGSITIANDCNGLSLLIFEEKWSNCASGPKSASSSDSFWVRQLFNVCVRVFCATILLAYIPAKIKMSFIWKMIFFFAKIGIFCKSIAGPLSPALFKCIYTTIFVRRKDKTNYLANQTWVKC